MTVLSKQTLTSIRIVDQWLDTDAGPSYQEQPLAQHWARVAKVDEEHGEAIAELILWTGQNPRKPFDSAAKHRMLAELADKAITAILAIQHFTKDETETDGYIASAIAKVTYRAAQAGYSS